MYTEMNQNQKLKWAMGHPLLSMNPMLFVMSTLWVQEHNRVCDVLAKEYPLWTDGVIYNTAKSIVIGEMIEIMMNEIITVHTGSSIRLKFRPEEYHERLQNIKIIKTPLELLLTTMWPSSLPEKFHNTSMNLMIFSNNRSVLLDFRYVSIELIGESSQLIYTFFDYPIQRRALGPWVNSWGCHILLLCNSFFVGSKTV